MTYRLLTLQPISDTVLGVDAATKKRLTKRHYGEERYTVLDVFTKGMGICGICHEAIDPTIIWPHPMALVRDHIVCRASGGVDLLENVQPAHYVCNSRKAGLVDQPKGPRGKSLSSEQRSDGEKRHKKLVDLDQSTADILQAVAATTGFSQNAIVNQAILHYGQSETLTSALSSPNPASSLLINYHQSLPVVHDQWAETVAKLGGKKES